MIDLIMQQSTDVFFIRVAGNDIRFSSSATGNLFTPIEGLHLNYRGVIKEFPDLTDREDWKQEAIKRFKEKIASFKTEDEKINYIMDDLRKHGFVPKYKQRIGHRREVIK